MGDDDAGTDFIKRKRVHDALRVISGASDLTLVVGAGPSAEIGFPLWPELIRRVLVRAVEKANIDSSRYAKPKSAAGDVARQIIDRDGVLAAATMAQAMLGSNFLNTVRAELYDGVPDNVVPGQLHTEIARLVTCISPGSREVATTNYDILQEDALARSGATPVAVVGAEPATDDETFVRHLHGVITQDFIEHVVITEADYASLQSASTWQEEFLSERLASSCCLFVGTSMTDPNILRLLHKVKPSQQMQHVALFARMVVRSEDPATAESQRVREALASARWKRVGVRPVMTDYIMQLPEFLYEAHGLRSDARGHVAYPKRLKRWEETASERWHRLDRRSTFVAAQAELHAALTEALAEFEREIANAVVDRAEETFSLRLFSRIPSEHQLLALASSEMEWRDPDAVDREKIERPARHVAVEAFCQGATVVAALDQTSGPRWRTVRAVPIILSDGPFGRLPVGVMTIASTATKPNSILPGLSVAAPVAEQMLIRLGCRLLGFAPEGQSGAPT